MKITILTEINVQHFKSKIKRKDKKINKNQSKKKKTIGKISEQRLY